MLTYICGCKTSTAWPKPSSIEFRRKINGIKSLQEFIDFRDYFILFVESRFKNKEYVELFLEKFEEKVSLISSDNEDQYLEYLKIWLFNYGDYSRLELRSRLLGNSDRPDPENSLYNFLYQNYSELNDSFHDFYDNYSANVDNPLNRNHVGRALTAFGLKAIMKRIRINGKPKCTMMLYASRKELADAFRRNAWSIN
jgi:hypothetical protein